MHIGSVGFHIIYSPIFTHAAGKGHQICSGSRIRMQLKICSWNIQGSIRRKLEYSELAQFIGQFDIFCIQESWLSSDIKLAVPGYHIFRSDRKKSSTAKRGSGGTVTLFKEKLQKGLTKITQP